MQQSHKIDNHTRAHVHHFNLYMPFIQAALMFMCAHRQWCILLISQFIAICVQAGVPLWQKTRAPHVLLQLIAKQCRFLLQNMLPYQ